MESCAKTAMGSGSTRSSCAINGTGSTCLRYSSWWTSGWRISYNASPFFPVRIPKRAHPRRLAGRGLRLAIGSFAAMWAAGCLNGNRLRDLRHRLGPLSRGKLLPITPRAIFHDVLEALRGRLAHEDLSVYNAAQRAAYLAIIPCASSCSAFSGLAIWEAGAVAGDQRRVFGGYEGARVVHFLADVAASCSSCWSTSPHGDPRAAAPCPRCSAGRRKEA